jgi:hypothetical protein
METEVLLPYSQMPPIFPVLNQINKIYAILPYLFKTDCNIILTFTSGSST